MVSEVDAEEVVAPALSTYQDESTFTFDQVVEMEAPRKHLSLTPINDDKTLYQLLDAYYSIDEVVAYIKSKPQCKRITLQFPDNLVCDSSYISSELSRRLGLVNKGCDEGKSDGPSCQCNNKDDEQSIWILADTSYSPCCVDEVASEHINGDMVIHFGNACLNPVDKLEVGYVFGKPAIDFNSIVDKFKQCFNHDDKIVIMGDAPHSYFLTKLVDTLSDYPNLAYGDISCDAFPRAKIIGYSPKQSSHDFQLLNRCFHGIDSDDLEQSLLSYKLFHIGVPETPRLLKLTTIFESVTLYDAENDKINQGPYPNLMRRYKHMLMAKSAGTIGLLVNTLSLSNTKLLLNGLKSKIQRAGKKHYMFVVGKPNVAKLANFEAIDLWCILGCDQQGIIVDQHNEYFKPIITPFELLLALNEELTWSGKWETDFNQLVKQIEAEDGEDHDHEYNDEPVFNPITGTLTSNSQPLRRQEYLSIAHQPDHDDTTSLVKKFSSDVVIRDTVSTAAISLQSRAWKGLGTDYDDDEDINHEGALVEEGTGGVARGYDFDIQQRK